MSAGPLRIAVVGSGPAGFYAAGHALAHRDDPGIAVEVDMFDRLPTPWGLVRGGVAPDHPRIKAVARVFEKTAAAAGFRFFGNVEVGRDVTRDDLVRRYHAVIYAVGAQADRRMGIPGEELDGSFAATQFVAWYNGHPDHREHAFDLSCRRAVVVGNGNVAIDVARMLALTPAELAGTDVADHALEQLARSSIEEIVVLGRRGPAQAAFTNPELLELGEMTDADVVVDPAELVLDEHSARSLADAGVTARRNVEILEGYSRREPAGRSRRIVLRFLVSPVAIVGDGRVAGVELVRNELVRDAHGGLRARATGRRETLAAGIVFRSIGYRGVALPGVAFDERTATIPHAGGRLVDPRDGAVVGGEYVAGWIKRGPSGVIGTNKKDALETVAALLADARAGRLRDPGEAAAGSIDALLRERAPGHVTYAGWEAIDRAERAAGEAQDRPRVKLCTVAELLAVADGSALAAP